MSDDIKQLRRAGVSRDRAKHGGLELYDKGSQPRARHIVTLDKYHREGRLNDSQLEAGRQLYRDWAASGFDPWATRPDNGPRGSGGSRTLGLGPRAMEYLEARDAVPMLERVVVVHVAIANADLTKVAGDEYSRKTLWTLLRRGLDRLVQHYRLG